MNACNESFQALKHPNIVRLYDVIETDKYIGIIIEYASGGELFDHILAHRYLREKDAAKLFSQLISGVWYIHQKKIVHRDLKLENLLLDRNRNVLITDFGFANKFEHRSDDLMQTSCGSPCYAAPELVISEGLYVGSAVDIWSCGVILYAMIAGYLPFDDDPANPDGDNINLLYKYIVNTPLSFPDYISESARSLLSMMLVPDPAHRASLEQVMLHPWLAGHVKPRDDLDITETAFGRTVEDLEQAAMDQHTQKRLAYQKQMRQASGQQSPDKVSRSQSYRPENGHSQPPPSAHPQTSSRSQSVQPNNLLYQTSPELEQSSSRTPAPFSAPISGPNGSHYDNGLLDGDDPFAAPPGVSSSDVIDAKAGKKAARPHTVQVEYDGPRERERSSRKERSQIPEQTPGPSPISPKASAGRQSTEKSRRPSASESKPLPPSPSPHTAHASTPSTPSGRERTTSQTTPRGRRPVETPSITLVSPPDTPVVFATSQDSEADREKTSQASSKHTRTPSSASKFAKNEAGNTSASSSLLSPASEKDKESDASGPPSTDKKSRRSSLTVIINRTIKGRKNRMSTTPTSAVASHEKDVAPTPRSPLPPPSSYTEVSSRTPDAEDSPVNDRDAGMHASTGKARKVMTWFRSRSKARESVGVADPNRSQYDEEYDQSFRQQEDRNASSSTINQQNASHHGSSVQATPAHRSKHGSHAPQRTPSSATDASATPSFVARFRNSVTVGGGGGHHEKSHSKTSGSTTGGYNLRIHHGAVDQDMVTTRPPPEVIEHVKQVLLGMGIEVQLESEFKYRCIRAKRKKAPGALAGNVGASGGLAAVNMMGSAASNGVSNLVPFSCLTMLMGLRFLG